MDETSIRDYQALQKAWCRKGKQKKVPTYGKHHSVKIIGALDYESGEVLCIEEEKFTAVEFEAFLKQLLEKHPNEKIIVILDNARIHHANYLAPFLEEYKKQLELMFLPPYSPDLNMIEELWEWLKSTVINNVFYEKPQELTKAVRGFFSHINKTCEQTRERLCLQY